MTFLLFLLASFKDHLGAAHIGLYGTHRAFDDQTHPHRRGQVINDIRPVHQFGHQGLVAHIRNGVGKVGVAFQGVQIFDGAGGKVIHHLDLLALGDEMLGQMRPYETRPPGYQGAGGFGRQLIHDNCIASCSGSKAPKANLKDSALFCGHRFSAWFTDA